MSIQTQAGVPVLDSSDFQYTFNGVTFGLKLRHFPAMDGIDVTSLVLVEKNGTSWDFKTEIDRDFLGELESNMSNWLGRAVTRINAWLSSRFSGVSLPPSNVPASLVSLDAALKNLRVDVVNGVPQVRV